MSPRMEEVRPPADYVQTDNSSSEDESSTSSPLASRESSNSDLKSMVDDNHQSEQIAVAIKKPVSLDDRSRIPNSFYLSASLVLTAHFCGNIWSQRVVLNWAESMQDAGKISWNVFIFLRDLTNDAFHGKIENWVEFSQVCIFTGLVVSLLYVLLIAPLRAGFWSGSRSSKHKMHRYMGLAYLIQYFAAWTQYLANYESAKGSYLPHFIALNGVIQGYSAFFSFKVLPELDDPGYYSDKAVASRNFVHENIFFSMMAVFGSMYYNEEFRHSLKSHWAGRIVEAMFVFFPYILIRPWFPTTRFSNAGKGRMGRTKKNQLFYEIGTKMVKFFYLWAKYYLGFFVNFLVFLEAPTSTQWKFLHGLYLLNLGTISIAVFLHTLRFKKVLPAKLTFSIYLLQIYATFSAIPLAYDMFVSHKLLCGLCLGGILLNLTRSRPLHGVWCCGALYLLNVHGDRMAEW